MGLGWKERAIGWACEERENEINTGLLGVLGVLHEI